MHRFRVYGLIVGAAVAFAFGLSTGAWGALLPFVLAFIVWTRLLGGYDPTDVVLSAVAVPCVLLTAIVTARTLTTGSGVNWIGAVSLGTGSVLALAIVADIAAARLV